MQLLPNAKSQFIDSGGQPLANGTVGFYFPGTLNPKATYQDSAGTIANPNPVPLDSRGQALIWGSGVYRQILKDASGVTIWDQITEDPNAGLTGDLTDAVFVAGTDFTPGTTTQLTLPVTPGSICNTWIFFDAAYQDDAQATLNGTTLTFSSPIPVGVGKVTVKIGTTIAVGTPTAGSVIDATVAAGANIDSSKLSFLQAGAGTLRRTVQDKLRDRVSVKDFGAKGDGVTDDTAAITAACAWLSGNASKCELVFPAGTYKYSVSPNWAIQNAVIRAEGEVFLLYTGTGNAVILDTGSTINTFTYNVTMGPFIVRAPTTALHGVYIRSIHHSKLRFKVEGAGATSDGIRVDFAVCTNFDNCSVTPNEAGAWYLGAKPMNGIHLAARNTGEQVSYCNFVNPVCEGLSTAGGAGILLDGTLGNTFYGGTAEGCAYGVLTGTAAIQNKFFGIDLESNATDDIYDQGQGNEFHGVDSATHVTVSGLALFPKFFGGNYKSILIGGSAKYAAFNNINYNRTAGGGITNNEPTTIFNDCIDLQAQKVGPFTQGAIATPASGSAYTNTTGNKQWVTIVSNGATISAVAIIRGGVNNNVAATTTEVLLAPGDGVSLAYSVATPVMYFYSE